MGRSQGNATWPIVWPKIVLLTTAALLTAAAVYLSVLIQERQEALSETSRYDLSWAAAQSAVELSRLGQSLGQYHIAPSPRSARDVFVRYEILLSRMGLFEGSAFLSASLQDPAIKELLAEVRQSVNALEPLVTAVDTGTNLQQAMHRIAALAPRMTQLGAAANNFGGTQADASHRELLRLHWAFSIVSLGLVLGGALQLLSLARQNRTLQRTREALSQQNARFDAAIENMPHGLAMFDSDRRMTVCNKRLPVILGLPPQAITTGATLQDMVAQAEATKSTGDSVLLQALAEELAQARGEPITHKLPDGRTLSISRRRMEDGGSVYTFEDITQRIQAESDRAQLEAQLQQAQKMEAIGQLTGGIAHDFNNLLTVILGNAELITEDTSSGEPTRALSRMILEASERGADLTQKLLAFGRRQSLRPEQTNIADAVSGMIPLLRRAIGEHIDLRTDFGVGSVAALVDRSLLESAVLNLAVNARDAMPQGGVLLISTGVSSVRAGEGALKAGDRAVFVRVADTGTGMGPDVLARVFEPFFTTKEVGKGSGLGLAMVYGFAQQSGGHVTVESQVGEGTAVTILLPALTGKTETSSKAMSPPAPVRGSGRVLVVEDEPHVLEFVGSQLRGLGYDVTVAPTGVEALAMIEQGGRYDLLFTDVVLPKGLSGVELAEKARRYCPDIKVLLTSGYSEEIFRQHGRPGDLPLLNKPYRRAELAEAVKRALEGAPRAAA